MQSVRLHPAQLVVVEAVTDHRVIYYCRFRERGSASRLLAVSAVRPLAERACRRLAFFMAIELRPLASASEPRRGR